jgi:ribosome-binding protein aMBF1 (putative translation factor)
MVATSKRIIRPGGANESDETATRQKLDAYRQKVGDQIRLRRESLGMTQEQLSEITGLSQSHICRLEVGKHAPTFTTMERLASALQTTPDQLDPGFPDE